ncbi:hypothetical protein [Paenibacillus sp. Marseille-Q4541]|uniref:hypothetical protein n=1 Tax=Paenibacillus sp. Marseille-Q4541 TaxID=2831522 RepID=UPI001BA5F3A8|nr:hypothetical protein [Paenibacillus sp. Marseille-Q4541]
MSIINSTTLSKAIIFITGMSGTGKSTVLAETNDYGKTLEQREEIINYVKTVEPLLRSGASYEIDTRQPIDQVVAELELIATQQIINNSFL